MQFLLRTNSERLREVEGAGRCDTTTRAGYAGGGRCERRIAQRHPADRGGGGGGGTSS